MVRIVALLIALSLSLAQAWSACGHHIVDLIAYERLTEEEQAKLRELLAEHPRYAEGFDPPAKVDDPVRWRIGRAGCWPDVARGTEYDRPTWRYQLGATLVIGDESEVNLPETPGTLPADATLETRELHIAQAVELCRRVMANRDSPAGDRALALCWLAYLLGDSHQSCPAGSLYAAKAFPDGDRGTNEIKVRNGRNLHALWDGLLGRRFDENRVRREVQTINSGEWFREVSGKVAVIQDPLFWLLALGESEDFEAPHLNRRGARPCEGRFGRQSR